MRQSSQTPYGYSRGALDDPRVAGRDTTDDETREGIDEGADDIDRKTAKGLGIELDTLRGLRERDVANRATFRERDTRSAVMEPPRNLRDWAEKMADDPDSAARQEAAEDASVNRQARRQIGLRQGVERHLDSILPGDFREMTFDRYTPTTASQRGVLDGCRAWADEYLTARERRVRPPSLGLLICGPNSTGKTHLGVAILLAVARPGTRVEFCRTRRLLSQMQSCYARDEDAFALRARYDHADVLLLDDLGAEKATEWAVGQLFEIADERGPLRLPTIITTNLSVEAFDGLANGTRGGDLRRVYTRLREMVVDNVYVLDGADYRARGRLSDAV